MLFWQNFCGGAICVANLRNILIFNKISILSCGFNRLDWVRVHVPLWNICTKNSSNNSVSMSCTTNIYHLLLVVHGKPYWPREKHEVLMTHMALFSFLISQVIIWIENLLNYTLISRIPMNNKDTNSITMMSLTTKTFLKSTPTFLKLSLRDLVIYHGPSYPGCKIFKWQSGRWWSLLLMTLAPSPINLSQTSISLLSSQAV